MGTYSFMDGVAGRPGVGSSGTQPPAAGSAYSGNYIAGLVFQATQGNIWFEGYKLWVPALVNVTTPVKFALWEAYGNLAGGLVPGSVITSGTLTANQFNYISLATPLQLSPLFPYVPAAGINGNFPLTQNQFGSGNPYAAGITNGPISCFAGAAAGAANIPQSPFTTSGGSDPAATMPVFNDAYDLLWLDIQATDVAPADATYRAFPNLPVGSIPGLPIGPQASAYTLAREVSFTAPVKVLRIWIYSPPTATSLPTRCGIWNVSTQTEVAGSDNSAPAWKVPGGSAAAAGDGQIYCDYSASGLVLQSGVNYKPAVFNSDNTDVWFAASANTWGTGDILAGGITCGPLVISGNSGATPGQDSWNLGNVWAYPNTSSNPECDWTDIEVGLLASKSGLLMATMP